MVNFFLVVTTSCNFRFATAVVACFVLILWRRREYRSALAFIVSAAGSSASAYILKFIIARPRPPMELAVYFEPSYSFPSGHATAAVAIYGFLFYILYKKVTVKYRKWVAFVGVFFILMIGFSRVYLGVHYPSDVLGGFFLGALWLGFAIRLSSSSSSIKK